MQNVLTSPHPLSIAPMIDWTHTHFRVFMRLLLPKALLYTEMQTIGAVLNNPDRALTFAPIESPVALQLGGADPEALAKCAVLAEQLGYAEVNLNLGCPSDRVQAGRFGACMMAEPNLAAECISAMKAAVNIPITAKTRIGIDQQDSFEFFAAFIDKLLKAGADKIIVHARKAWLKGLNPKQNRTIPPLHYDYVYRIKTLYPNIPIVINGHINTIESVEAHMQHVDGVMIGRLACQNPYYLTKMHRYFYPSLPLLKREEVLQNYLSYWQGPFSKQAAFSFLLKPLYTLFHGCPNAKLWKAQLMAVQKNKDIQLLKLEIV